MNDIDDKYKEPTSKEYIKWIWGDVADISLASRTIQDSLEKNGTSIRDEIGLLSDNVVKLGIAIIILLALILWRVW